ncbi:argonaute 5 [Dionaea muscipula]
MSPTTEVFISIMKELEFKVTITLASKVSVHNLREFLLQSPRQCIQALNIILQAANSSVGYIAIGRSLFSSALGIEYRGEILEYSRGFYHSLRPAQMDFTNFWYVSYLLQ